MKIEREEYSIFRLMIIINIVLLVCVTYDLYFIFKDINFVLPIRIIETIIFAMWIIFNVCEKQQKEIEYSNQKIQKIINIFLLFVLEFLNLICYYKGEIKNFLLCIICIMILFGIWNTVGRKIINTRIIIGTFIIGIIGLMAIGFAEDLSTIKKSNEAKVYEFSSEEVYNQFKKLYNHDKYNSYIITEFTNDTLITRDLLADSTGVFSFESDEELNDFVKNKTMGKGVYVPMLGDECKFDDSNMSVKYKTAITENERIEVQQDRHKIGMVIWHIWINICISFSVLYGWKKQSSK